MANFKINTDSKFVAIPNSKLKALLLLIGALIFVAAGLWFIINPATPQDSFDHRLETKAIVAGYLSVVFFGICALAAVVMLVSNKPALIVDDEGIAITSAFGAPNFVSWFDIEKFEIGEIKNVTLIYIYLINTEKYINDQKVTWRKKMMSLSYNRFGVALSISTSVLKCDFNELFDFLCSRLADFKAAEKSTHFSAEA